MTQANEPRRAATLIPRWLLSWGLPACWGAGIVLVGPLIGIDHDLAIRLVLPGSILVFFLGHSLTNDSARTQAMQADEEYARYLADVTATNADLARRGLPQTQAYSRDEWNEHYGPSKTGAHHG